MSNDQVVALLLTIADMRLVIEQQNAEIGRLNEQAELAADSSNGAKKPAAVPQP
jgi:hypothetical protein